MPGCEGTFKMPFSVKLMADWAGWTASRSRASSAVKGTLMALKRLATRKSRKASSLWLQMPCRHCVSVSYPNQEQPAGVL